MSYVFYVRNAKQLNNAEQAWRKTLGTNSINCAVLVERTEDGVRVVTETMAEIIYRLRPTVK